MYQMRQQDSDQRLWENQARRQREEEYDEPEYCPPNRRRWAEELRLQQQQQQRHDKIGEMDKACKDVLFANDMGMYIFFSITNVDDIVALSRTCRRLYTLSNRVIELRMLRWIRTNFVVMFQPRYLMLHLTTVTKEIRPWFIRLLMDYGQGNWHRVRSANNTIGSIFKLIGRTLVENNDKRAIGALHDIIYDTNMNVPWLTGSNFYQGVAMESALRKNNELFKWATDFYALYFLKTIHQNTLNDGFTEEDFLKGDKLLPANLSHVYNNMLNRCLCVSPGAMVDMMSSWGYNLLTGGPNGTAFIIDVNNPRTHLNYVFGLYGHLELTYLKWVEQYAIPCICKFDSDNEEEMDKAYAVLDSQFMTLFANDVVDLEGTICRYLLCGVFDPTKKHCVSRKMFVYLVKILNNETRRGWLTPTLIYKGVFKFYQVINILGNAVFTWMSKTENCRFVFDIEIDESRIDYIEWIYETYIRNVKCADPTVCFLLLPATFERHIALWREMRQTWRRCVSEATFKPDTMKDCLTLVDEPAQVSSKEYYMQYGTNVSFENMWYP